MNVVEKLIIIRQSITLRNTVYWFMVIICVLNGITFLYKLLIDIHNVVSLWEIGVPFELALYSGIIAIMVETDNNRHLKQGLAYLTLLTVMNAMLIVCKSTIL